MTGHAPLTEHPRSQDVFGLQLIQGRDHHERQHLHRFGHGLF